MCNKGSDTARVGSAETVQVNPDYEEQERREAEFFASRPELRDITTKLGVAELSKELIKIQEEMLRQHMPTFVRQVQNMLCCWHTFIHVTRPFNASWRHGACLL